MYIPVYSILGWVAEISIIVTMDGLWKESPAPTDRMPKNSRMNNYFLIGGWQRKSGITNFPKFCIELHSSLLTLPAAGGQDTDRKSVAKKCSEQPAPAQPSQPSPGGTTPDLQTVHQPSTRQTLLAAQLLKYASWSKSTFPLTSDMFSWLDIRSYGGCHWKGLQQSFKTKFCSSHGCHRHSKSTTPVLKLWAMRFMCCYGWII